MERCWFMIMKFITHLKVWRNDGLELLQRDQPSFKDSSVVTFN